MAKKSKKNPTIDGSMQLAAKHLRRVVEARNSPDWDDLSIYGFYCLEALVRAAVIKTTGTHGTKSHWDKAKNAKELTESHGLPAIDGLLKLLNEARKSEAYDDEDFDEAEHDAGDIAGQIQEYFNAVQKFVSK